MEEIFTVVLPDIGEGVVEGEVIEWLKQVGDVLAQDEPVVVVMTDKATVELPSPYPGKLAKQHYQVGQIAIKDKPLYDIELEGGVHVSKEVKNEPKPVEKALEKPCPAKEIKPIHSQHHALATPKVRQLAKELNADINQISGTGKDGQVTLEDIQKTLSVNKKQTSIPSSILHFADDEEVQIRGIPLLMAKKMSESNEIIPHFSYFEQVDATRLVQLREKFKEEAVKLKLQVTYMPFLIKALSLTLKEYPQVNSSLDQDRNMLVIHKHHNIGIAMTTDYGLIVPVLKNVQDISLHDLVSAYETLKSRALSGTLKSIDMKESTITISNFGVLGGGGLWATPVINYPESAILGVARIQKQPVVKNDAVVVRDSLNLSWSFDHRVVDGDMAAAFSHHFATLIQNPASML